MSSKILRWSIMSFVSFNAICYLCTSQEIKISIISLAVDSCPNLAVAIKGLHNNA